LLPTPFGCPWRVPLIEEIVYRIDTQYTRNYCAKQAKFYSIPVVSRGSENEQKQEVRG
jgi:hypothetical protein